MAAWNALSPEQRRVVGAYWWTRAVGEMTSWVGWQHVRDDLLKEGSPAPVIALAQRAVKDEYQHALWCRDWAERFGHPVGDIVPRGERPLSFPRASEAENRLLRIALCCFTESVGCFTLRHVKAVLTDLDLKKLNRRHMADELQHSRVGWAHLATLDQAQRDFLRQRLPQLLSLLERVCCVGAEKDHEELVPYGYFTRRLLRAAHDEALAEVILPGLEHLGIARAA